MKLLSNTLLATLLTTFVVGCGDQINTKTYATKIHPTYPRVTGVFIDSGVKGLNYTVDINSTEESSKIATNITGEGGSFEYFYGDILLFKVGQLEIGKAIALSTVTPKDIVAYKNLDLNTSIYSSEVNNRVRVLMSLDEDGAPENGISISAATRERAKSWSTPDYTLGEDAFTESFNKATNNELSKIFTKKEAENHFASSLRCVYSGAYRGSWILPDGAREGFVGVMIQSDGSIVALGDGQDVNGDGNYSEVIYASGIHNMDTGTYNFSETFHFDVELGRIVSSNLTNISGDGSSRGYDEVSGSFVQDGQKGEYTAYRVGAGINTAYRYTGSGLFNNTSNPDSEEDPILGLFTFDIQKNGLVTGMIHDARTNEEPSLNGKINFETGDVNLTLNSGLGHTVSGNIDFTTSNLYLTWYDANGTKLGYLQGLGCQLQEATSYIPTVLE